jgi:16S rRNA (adenine1518-N6/adenine1519-N6)-dimethyltransferase
MTFDPRPLLDGKRARIVANLPYNIATVLLIDWLCAEPATVVRHDGADVSAGGRRAHRGPRERRRLWPPWVLANWRAETKILFDISPSAFVPPPKVTSSVVRLIPRAAPEPVDRRALERVASAAFGQRRKMLRQSLKSLGVDPALPPLPQASTRPAEQRLFPCPALLPWPGNWRI